MESLELKKIEFKAMIVAELTECFDQLILLKSSLENLQSSIVSEFENKIKEGVFEERKESLIFSDYIELNYVFKIGNICSRKELKALLHFSEKRKIYFELESLEQSIFCRLKLGNKVKTQFILDSNKKQ